jgi:hypothetical protein
MDGCDDGWIGFGILRADNFELASNLFSFFFFFDIIGIKFQTLRRGRPRYDYKISCINQPRAYLYSITVVLLKSGPSAGNIAVITEIIDHTRVI